MIPTVRAWDGIFNSFDWQQLYDICRTVSPFISPLSGLLAFKWRDAAAFVYDLYYTTNYNPRLASESYLYSILRLVGNDRQRWVTMREFAKNICDGGVEIRLTFRYMKLKGLVETMEDRKHPDFCLTDKGLKHARRKEFIFSKPDGSLQMDLTRYEKLVSWINQKLGRRNTL